MHNGVQSILIMYLINIILHLETDFLGIITSQWQRKRIHIVSYILCYLELPSECRIRIVGGGLDA